MESSRTVVPKSIPVTFTPVLASIRSAGWPIATASISKANPPLAPDREADRRRSNAAGGSPHAGTRPTIADRVADRVVDYLGWSGRWRLRTRRWSAGDCRLLAQTATAVLNLKRKLHEVTGEAVSRLLPPDTPRFHRMLVKKIAAKVPLPPDVKLEAIARGLQVIGIFMCIVGDVPLERCACLRMLAPQLLKEHLKQHIEELLEETERDLRGRQQG